MKIIYKEAQEALKDIKIYKTNIRYFRKELEHTKELLQKNKKYNILNTQELKSFERGKQYAEDMLLRYNNEIKFLCNKYELDYDKVVGDLNG